MYLSLFSVAHWVPCKVERIGLVGGRLGTADLRLQIDPGMGDLERKNAPFCRLARPVKAWAGPRVRTEPGSAPGT